MTTSRARQGGIPTGRGEETTFFVAPSGSGAWSGRLSAANAQQTDGPFATLVQARDAVRDLKTREKGPITVMVRGGKYHLDETLELTESDSGTRECPITWRAYPDETPVLSGGRVVSGWRPYKGDILQCDLPEAMGGKWRFRQLFFNGRRQTRARYPKFDPENPLHGGWASAEDPDGEGSPLAFRYKPGTFPRRWVKPTEAEVFLLSPNPPTRSGLGVGTRGEGRGTRRSALDSDKWGRWRPLVVVGDAYGGPGSGAGAGSAGQHAGEDNRGPGRCDSVGRLGSLVDGSGAVGAVRQAMAGLAIEPGRE